MATRDRGAIGKVSAQFRSAGHSELSGLVSMAGPKDLGPSSTAASQDLGESSP